MKRAFNTMGKPDVICPPKTVALVERNVEPRGIPLIDPEAVAKTSRQDIVALAREVEKAEDFVKAIACNKLQVITEQINSLRIQMENILVEAERNMKLHHVACNFVKHPGQYKDRKRRRSIRINQSKSFSGTSAVSVQGTEFAISQEECGSSGPSQFYKGSYRLEQDHSWTALQEDDEKNKGVALSAKLLSSGPTTASAFESGDLNVNV